MVYNNVMLHEEKLDLPLSNETLKAKCYPQKIVIMTYDFGRIELYQISLDMNIFMTYTEV